jgi:hypothetical protein
MAHLIEHAARCEGKTGEGKVSTEAMASTLGPPGKPIFSPTGCRRPWDPDFCHPPSIRLALADRLVRVAFPTPARVCMRVKRRTPAAVSDNDAAQRLNNALQSSSRPFSIDRKQPPNHTQEPARSDSYLDWNLLSPPDGLSKQLLARVDPCSALANLESSDVGCEGPQSDPEARTHRVVDRRDAKEH